MLLSWPINVVTIVDYIWQTTNTPLPGLKHGILARFYGALYNMFLILILAYCLARCQPAINNNLGFSVLLPSACGEAMGQTVNILISGQSALLPEPRPHTIWMCSDDTTSIRKFLESLPGFLHVTTGTLDHSSFVPISRSLIWSLRAITLVLSFHHRFLIGFWSGLWLGHTKNDHSLLCLPFLHHFGL